MLYVNIVQITLQLIPDNVTFRGAVKANSFHTVDLHAEKINGKALNSIIKENIPISEMRGNLYAKKLEGKLISKF